MKDHMSRMDAGRFPRSVLALLLVLLLLAAARRRRSTK